MFTYKTGIQLIQVAESTCFEIRSKSGETIEEATGRKTIWTCGCKLFSKHDNFNSVYLPFLSGINLL